MGNQIFSTRIKDFREKAGLSMEQLAKELGITKSRVNMWENNGTVPRMDTLMKLAKYFNTTTDYLVGYDCETGAITGSEKLNVLQRNLGKLSEEELDKAGEMLKIMFSDAFDDEEDDDGI